MGNRIHAFKQGLSRKREKRKLFLGPGSPFHTLYPKENFDKTLDVLLFKRKNKVQSNSISVTSIVKDVKKSKKDAENEFIGSLKIWDYVIRNINSIQKNKKIWIKNQPIMVKKTGR